LRLFSVKEKG